MAVLPHSPRVVYYHLLLREETRIPRVASFSFRNLGSFCAYGTEIVYIHSLCEPWEYSFFLMLYSHQWWVVAVFVDLTLTLVTPDPHRRHV